MFAPSPYTRPPTSWTAAQTSRTRSSKSPSVFGFVSMSPTTSGPSAALSEARSMLPRASLRTVVTSNPHIAADAGFVPCAESGTMTRRRVEPSPRDSW